MQISLVMVWKHNSQNCNDRSSNTSRVCKRLKWRQGLKRACTSLSGGLFRDPIRIVAAGVAFAMGLSIVFPVLGLNAQPRHLPAAPEKLVAYSDMNAPGRVWLSWNSPPHPDGAVAITHHEYRYRLSLSHNRLFGLPAEVFDGLTVLEELRLGGNSLAKLPAGLFAGLPALQVLDLRANQLTALPDGIFSGLTNLRALYLEGNSADPMVLAVSQELDDQDRVRALAPAAAPFDVVLTLSVTNGSLSGGVNTLTIPTGATASAPLQVNPDVRSLDTTVEIVALPLLPGAAGFAYSYRRIRVDSDGVGNPTDVGSDRDTYTLVAGDAGRKIKVQVSYTDDAGNAAEIGFGMELGGGLRYADPLLELTLETRARGLIAHEDGGYEEWGLSGSVQVDPGRAGRGLMLSTSLPW